LSCRFARPKRGGILTAVVRYSLSTPRDKLHSKEQTLTKVHLSIEGRAIEAPTSSLLLQAYAQVRLLDELDLTSGQGRDAPRAALFTRRAGSQTRKRQSAATPETQKDQMRAST
jgi:hypothetical protein